MSRPKATRPELSLNNEAHVSIPRVEKSVHKRVPATIHWATVEGNDRTDSERIGEAIIYEDGTTDVIVLGDISEDAKKFVQIIQGELDHMSMEN